MIGERLLENEVPTLKLLAEGKHPECGVHVSQSLNFSDVIHPLEIPLKMGFPSNTQLSTYSTIEFQGVTMKRPRNVMKRSNFEYSQCWSSLAQQPWIRSVYESTD